MLYTVKSNSSTPYTLQEKDEVSSILQNVRLIVSTVIGSCPMYRHFGIDTDFIDKPMNAAQALIRTRIIESVEEFEKRAVIKSVTFSEIDNNSGSMAVELEVEI